MSSVLKWNFITAWLRQHNSLGKQGSWILHLLPRACKHRGKQRMIVSEILPQILYSYLLKLSCVPGVPARNKKARLWIKKDVLLMLGSLHLEVMLCTLRLSSARGADAASPATKDQGCTGGPRVCDPSSASGPAAQLVHPVNTCNLNNPSQVRGFYKILLHKVIVTG